MAQRPQRRCGKCSRPTRNKGGKCDACKRVKTPISRERQTYEQTPARKELKRFLCSKQWRDFRRWMLMQEPRCVLCMKEKPWSVQPAVVIHHVKPRETHPELTYEPSNIVGLCNSHHSRVEGQIRAGKTIDFETKQVSTNPGVGSF